MSPVAPRLWARKKHQSLEISSLTLGPSLALSLWPNGVQSTELEYLGSTQLSGCVVFGEQIHLFDNCWITSRGHQ